MTLIFYALGILLFILALVSLAHGDGLQGYLLWGLMSLCVGIGAGYSDYQSAKRKEKRTMSIIQKHITFFGQPCTLACDAKCHKAWGINNRPQIYLDDPTQTIRGYGHASDHYPQDMPEGFDENNTVYLTDDELPDAPTGSNGTHDDGAYTGLGTWEGGDGKPETEDERLNKWCARECERSIMPDGWIDVDPSQLPDFSVRRYNIDQSGESK